MRLCVFLIAVLYALPASAACVLPGGVEGEVVYNKDQKLVQYCDGTRWVGMGWKSFPMQAAGANGQVQFSQDGLQAGDAAFVWNNTTKVLTVTGRVIHDGALATVARPICYSALAAGAVNKGIIMIPLPIDGKTDLSNVCVTAINNSWGALGVAKPNLHGQNCHLELDNLHYGGGYTAFVPRAAFQTGANTTYSLCGPTNTIICCTPTSAL